MVDITNTLSYIFLFASLNFEVFLLVTYFENRHKMKNEDVFIPADRIKKYLSATIIVPCWNEENTISETIHSLLRLDYPKDKLKIIIVDDGSKDGTWQTVQKFKGHNQIELHKKENGGKYTALNFGLSKAKTDLVGCLDADSFVHKDALKHIVSYFQDKEIMAVAPSVKVWQPKSILELLQKVEYSFGIFTRKMFHYMEAVYITPGPFSLFRREVFEKLGGYKHAHNTEDIEIALRMQTNHYKIAHAHRAMVYTTPPSSLRKLLKQRVRWSYGFIKNAVDYKNIFFKKEYGNLGIIILPMAAISFASVLSLTSISLINMIRSAFDQYIKIQTVGLSFGNFRFDWFSINTEMISILAMIASIGVISLLLLSRKVSENKLFGMDLIYYLSIYTLIAPLWMGKAVYNAITGVKTTWR